MRILKGTCWICGKDYQEEVENNVVANVFGMCPACKRVHRAVILASRRILEGSSFQPNVDEETRQDMAAMKLGWEIDPRMLGRL